jgi:hypothetical protein
VISTFLVGFPFEKSLVVLIGWFEKVYGVFNCLVMILKRKCFWCKKHESVFKTLTEQGLWRAIQKSNWSKQ